MQKKIERDRLLHFSTSQENIHGKQSLNLNPCGKKFRILSYASLENLSKQKQHPDVEKTLSCKELCCRSNNFVIKKQTFFWC